jgi:hypothetical protein
MRTGAAGGTVMAMQALDMGGRQRMPLARGAIRAQSVGVTLQWASPVTDCRRWTWVGDKECL